MTRGHGVCGGRASQSREIANTNGLITLREQATSLAQAREVKKKYVGVLSAGRGRPYKIQNALVRQKLEQSPRRPGGRPRNWINEELVNSYDVWARNERNNGRVPTIRGFVREACRARALESGEDYDDVFKRERNRLRIALSRALATVSKQKLM